MRRAVRPDQIDERFVPVPSPAVHTVAIDGEAVLLDEERNRLHVLNATGAVVWACFDSEASIAEIVADISDVLEIPRDVVLADTLELTRHLGEHGLLGNVVAAPDAETDRDAEGEKPVDDPLGCDEVDVATTATPDDPHIVPEPPNP